MQRKIQVVLPRLQEQAGNREILGELVFFVGFFFFGKGEPGLAFVSWVCLQGYLDVKHSSNSCCILAQGFGKLTGLKGKTKCLSCKLITGLSIFLLIRRVCRGGCAAFCSEMPRFLIFFY